ncbi:MAG: FkbM family methyltransferase [Vulcanimicrobiaceae bacterium]
MADKIYRIAPHDFVATTESGFSVGGNTASTVERFICYFNVWEPNATAWLGRTLSDGDGFIDVGAHVGYFSLLAAKLVGTRGSVTAIEASPATFVKLTDNIARNGCTKTRAVNVAVAARHGLLQFYEKPDGNDAQGSIYAQAGFEPTYQVRSAPLLDVLEPAEIASARVIKVDVEGAEWLVSSDLVPALRGARRDVEIMLELNTALLATVGKTARDIVDLFAGAGFNAYVLPNDYHMAAYAPPRSIRPPYRCRTTPTGLVDLIFSRRDVVTL